MVSVKVLQHECRHDKYDVKKKKKVILAVICNIFATFKQYEEVLTCAG
jgi:hypothetical protein